MIELTFHTSTELAIEVIVAPKMYGKGLKELPVTDIIDPPYLFGVFGKTPESIPSMKEPEGLRPVQEQSQRWRRWLGGGREVSFGITSKRLES
jgi:hypothetical protein